MNWAFRKYKIKLFPWKFCSLDTAGLEPSAIPSPSLALPQKISWRFWEISNLMLYYPPSSLLLSVELEPFVFSTTVLLAACSHTQQTLLSPADRAISLGNNNMAAKFCHFWVPLLPCSADSSCQSFTIWKAREFLSFFSVTLQ